MAARVCARLAIAFCLIMFGFGGAVERGLSGHIGLGSALTLAATVDDAAGHPSDGADTSGVDVADHGCHGCAAAPHSARQGASSPAAFSERIAWVSVPSASSREPLVDLPPPRA